MKKKIQIITAIVLYGLGFVMILAEPTEGGVFDTSLFLFSLWKGASVLVTFASGLYITKKVGQ